MNQALWALSAVEVAAGIRAKKYSSREVTQAVLARIDATNPRINALPYVLTEEALAAADAADRAVTSGAALGVLHGVPVTTKVNIDQIGCTTTNGIAKLADLIATIDSPVVANLKASGAVNVGQIGRAHV